jgi:Chemotaxis response regulator containing a CheY-like receiver domain and a methylesterase domain
MPTKSPIHALIVDDSASSRLLLRHILTSDTRFAVLGEVGSGGEALAFLRQRHPDVVVMDIHMPGMDGYETTRQIMQTHPVPIVICTGVPGPDEVADKFRALEAGALALVLKPAGPGHPQHAETAAKLVETVALMSEIRVVKRWPRERVLRSPTPIPRPASRPAEPIEVIAIGTSTGGPPVLQTILASLPAHLPAPVLIVQHISAGFLPGLVEWLAQSSTLPVRIATHGESLQPGHVYLAPDGYHMGIGSSRQIALSRSEPENGLRPSVSFLFRSVASVCGARSIAVLLTGMGRDGAQQLKELKDLGAVTIAQDAETSVVHGMPGEAIRLGAANYILPPERIAIVVTSLTLGNAAPHGRAQPPL